MANAVIEGGVVVNLVEGCPPGASLVVPSSGAAQIGGTWDGSAFHPPAPIDPAILIAAMWESIKAERDRRTTSGGYTTAGKWFHSDDFSRIQQLGLVNLAAANQIPPNTAWKTMDGSFITMTAQLAQAIFAAAVTQDIGTFAAAEAHKAAMSASANPSAYDFSAGWPQTFGE